MAAVQMPPPECGYTTLSSQPLPSQTASVLASDKVTGFSPVATSVHLSIYARAGKQPLSLDSLTKLS